MLPAGSDGRQLQEGVLRVAAAPNYRKCVDRMIMMNRAKFLMFRADEEP